MRSMSWACHERSCFLLAFSHGVCMSSLRWTWKNIEIPGFPRSPEPSRTTNKQQKHQENMFFLWDPNSLEPFYPQNHFFYSKMQVPNLPPRARVDAPENPIRVGCPGGVDEHRGTWYRNSSTLITPSTRNYGYDLGSIPHPPTVK